MNAPNESAEVLKDPLLLDNQLCYALYAAAHRMTKSYRPMLERMGLTYPQYLVLLVLWEEEGLSVKEIGSRLFLDSGTLTPLLKRLEASGHVRRARDRPDERQVSIFLTEKGRGLKGKMDCLPLTVGGMTGMTLDERRALLENLALMRDELHARAGSVDMSAEGATP